MFFFYPIPKLYSCFLFIPSVIYYEYLRLPGCSITFFHRMEPDRPLAQAYHELAVVHWSATSRCVQTEVTFTALCARRRSTAAITATQCEYIPTAQLWICRISQRCIVGNPSLSEWENQFLSHQHKGDVTKQLFPFLITPTVNNSLTAADRSLVTGFLTKLKR